MTQADSQLDAIRAAACLGGGEDRIAKQHALGKQTARERITSLVDPGTFGEIGAFVTHRASGFGMQNTHPWGDGVVTGTGKIDGRPVAIYAQDFTVMGGSLGEAHGLKIARIIEIAQRNGIPLVGLNDSGGARIQEGVDSLAAYGEVFFQNVQASGVVPQISVIMGPCAGGAVYSPAITDFVFMVGETSHMFVTGPEVIKTVTREEIDLETLGGAAVHGSRSGVAHFTAADEDAVMALVRWLLSYLPSNNLVPPPAIVPVDDPLRLTPEMEDIVPDDPQQPYDVHKVIEVLVDDGEFLEVQRTYAENIVVGFARMNGHSTGIIANQPAHFAGVLDINASDKGARFVRFCDCFHIPIVTLVDTPGFLPGSDQEHDGIIRHGAKLIYAYAEATVPKTSIVLRKAYGGAYIVMSSRNLRSDRNLAWPEAQIAVMGAEGAVNIVFRKDLAKEADPDAKRAELVTHFRENFANPFVAASRGLIDDIIKPVESRARVIQALESLKDKRAETPKRKHGNIPL
jgi:acetyl-CoA carboxylase carboxyltransferase component